MRFLAHGPSWFAAFMLFLLMVMTFADVLLRSIFNTPIEAATELTRLFMALIVFSCLPIVTWRGGHIVVDLLDPLFSGRAAKVRDSLVDLACGILLLWPAMRVMALAERARSYGDTTEYLQIPQFYIAWFIAISAFITAIVLIIRAIIRFAKPEWLNESGMVQQAPQTEAETQAGSADKK